MPVGVSIRSAVDAELHAIGTVLRRAGFGAHAGMLLRLPQASEHGAVLVAERHGTLVGSAAALAFPASASGWIGAVGVVPQARGRGLGGALTEAAMAFLRACGARSIGLYATSAGRPVYERLGFAGEHGETVAWRGRRPPAHGEPPRPTIRALLPGDAVPAAAIDRAATGEERAPVLGRLGPHPGLVAVDDQDRPTGVALRSPWGSATAVLAGDERSGLALMGAALAAPGGGTLIVPEANAPAATAMRSWGLARLNDAQRMSFGPPVAWDPARQFATFNLFWG